MNEPLYGIFIPGDVFRQRLRVICQELGCSANEAMGAIVAIWTFGVLAADAEGEIRLTPDAMSSAVRSTLSDQIDTNKMISAMFMAGLIDRKDDLYELKDLKEVALASRRLEEFDEKLEKKRHLDMIRKQKRRAELKAEQPEKPKLAPKPPEPPKEIQKPVQVEMPAPEPEKPKPKKPEVPKIKYAEQVRMKEAEYQKLIDKYGKEATELCVEILNNYKCSKGKKYNSDYHAILMWVVDEAKKRKPALFTVTKHAEWHDDNPFG